MKFTYFSFPTSHIGLEVTSMYTVDGHIERKTYTQKKCLYKRSPEFHPYRLAALAQVNPEIRKQT